MSKSFCIAEDFFGRNWKDARDQARGQEGGNVYVARMSERDDRAADQG